MNINPMILKHVPELWRREAPFRHCIEAGAMGLVLLYFCGGGGSSLKSMSSFRPPSLPSASSFFQSATPAPAQPSPAQPVTYRPPGQAVFQQPQQAYQQPYQQPRPQLQQPRPAVATGPAPITITPAATLDASSLPAAKTDDGSDTISKDENASQIKAEYVPSDSK